MKFFEEIPEHLIEWILKQQMFWVATAPLSPDGHINISPKGIEGTFHVVNSRRVWYEDLSGTGAETVSHIRENGRITILFNAFEGPARIVRLYGKGFFHEIGSPEYDALLPSHTRQPGSRAAIGLDIFKVGTTCGYAVPYYQFISHRSRLIDWAAKKEATDRESKTSTSPIGESSSHIHPEGMKKWWGIYNIRSLDGLPAFSVGMGLGFEFEVNLERLLRGMRGDIPGSKVEVARNTGSPHRVIDSSALGPSSPSDQNLVPKMVSSSLNPVFETWSLSQILQGYRFRHEDLPSLVSALLPLFIAFVLGVLIGQMYDRHTFPLSLGTTRFSSSYIHG